MIDFRSADAADVPALLDLWSVAGENQSRPADAAVAVQALIARDPEAVIIATQAERLVGSVIAGWDGWRAHLYRLAVHPDVRRQGVAAHLLDRAEQRLTGCGAVRIDAMVLDENELGQTFWRSRGYERQSDWSRWVRPVISDRRSST